MKIKLPCLLYKKLMSLMVPAMSLTFASISTTQASTWAPENIQYDVELTPNASSGGWGIEGTSGIQGDHILNSNTSLIFQTNGNVGSPFTCTGLDIKLSTAAAGGQMSINDNITANSVWFAGGRFHSANNARLNNAGNLYVVGGQLWFTADNTIISNITVGTSNYTEANAYGNAALRVNGNTTLENLSVVENTKITMGDGKTLTINNMSGNDTVHFDSYGNDNNIIRLASNYDGAINLSATGGKVALQLTTNNTTYKSFSLGNNTKIQIDNGVSANVGSLSSSSSSSILSFGDSSSKLTITGNDSTTYAGKLTGEGTLVKNGTGILTVTGNNDNNFNGGIEINNGTVHVASSNFLTSQNNVSVSSGATLQIKGNGPISVTLGDLTLFSGSTLALNLTSDLTNVLTINNLFTPDGTDTATYNLTLTSLGMTLDSGNSYDLITVNTSTEINKLINFSLDSSSLDLSRGQSASVAWVDNVLKMTISGIATPSSLTWQGTTGNMIWDKTNKNWFDGSISDSFHSGDHAIFESNGAGTVSIADAIYAKSVTINGGDYIFTSQNGGKISGNSTLIVSGGSASLNLSNDYTGGTTVNGNGTLNINVANAAGTGPITVDSANARLNITKEAIASILNIDIRAGHTTIGSSGKTLNSGSYNTTFTGNAGSLLEVWLTGNLSDTGGGNGDNVILSNLGSYNGVLEIRSGLLNVSTDDKANGTVANLEKIVLNGGGLVFKNGAVTINNDIEVMAGTIGILRPYGNGNATLSGEISGGGSIKHTDGGTLTLSGKLSLAGNVINAAGTTVISGDISNYTGTFQADRGTIRFNYNQNVTISQKIIGSGSINFSGTGIKTLSSDLADFDGVITIGGGAMQLGSASMLNNRDLNISGGEFLVVEAGTAVKNITISGTGNKINTINGADLTIERLHNNSSDFQLIGNVTATGYIGSFDNNRANMTITDNSVLTLTGTNTTNQSGTSTFMISNHPQNNNVVTVNGTLNLLNAYLSNRDGNGTLNIDRGTLNISKLDYVRNSQVSMTVNVTNEGRINVGAAGTVSAAGLSLNMNNGTIGTLASSWANSGLAINLTGHNKFDTEVQSVNSTTGKASGTGQGANIVMNGIITGTGNIEKTGIGVLTLNGANTYSGNTIITEGTLKAGSSSAFGLGVLIVKQGAHLDLNSQNIANNITYQGGSISNYGQYTGSITASNSGLILTNDYQSALIISEGISVTLSGAINWNEAQFSTTNPLFSLSSLTLESNALLSFDLTNLSELQEGNYTLLGITEGSLGDISQYTLTGNFAPGLTGSLSFNDNNQIVLSVTTNPIPEPTTTSLSLLGLAALLLRRKRSV